MKILLTGGTGMVGKNILEHPSAKNHTIFAPKRSEMNLLNQLEVRQVFSAFKPDLVIHAAGLVGGIQANSNALFDFMNDNLQMGLNVIMAARESEVKNLINLGSTCMYPKDSQQPMKEEYLFSGPLEPTNEGYAIAKTAVQRACEYTVKEKGWNYKTYIPCNLFGKYDHFDSNTSHLLPAIIKKVHNLVEEIKLHRAYEAEYGGANNQSFSMSVWGSGNPRREIMDAADLADFIFFSISSPEIFKKTPDVLNVSPGKDFSIRELYTFVIDVLLEKEEFSIEYKFDTSKPDGMFRKLSDVTKLSKLGWSPPTAFSETVKKAYNDYRSTLVKNKDNKEMKSDKQCALITGVNGQDGSYLAELLLEKGYRVVGMVRRTSQPSLKLLEGCLKSPDFELVCGNMQDSNSLWTIINDCKPNEIYNLAAQSHVRVSFDCPEETFDVVAMGTLRLLNAAKALVPNVKFYQAGSSEQFGSNSESPQNEKTAFMPASPYACAKVAAHNICINYRESYGMFISVGILHNHESPRRGEAFVTRKITKAAARIKLGLQDKLELGNLDAKRDWGFAKEYVEFMWKMLQHKRPEDFVIATGETHSVREFLEAVFEEAGLDVSKYVSHNISLSRPQEVNLLLGDPTKAERELGWKAQTKFKELAKLMYQADFYEENKNKDKEICI